MHTDPVYGLPSVKRERAPGSFTAVSAAHHSLGLALPHLITGQHLFSAAHLAAFPPPSSPSFLSGPLSSLWISSLWQIWFALPQTNLSSSRLLRTSSLVGLLRFPHLVFAAPAVPAPFQLIQDECEMRAAQARFYARRLSEASDQLFPEMLPRMALLSP